MKKNYFVFLIMSLFISLVAMTACSSDDDPKKIELADGTPAKLNLTANQTNGVVNFTASASWSAWTAKTTNGGPEEVDWLTIGESRGSAGTASITITLEPNKTGKSRTAYIVIICEDEKIVIEITQTVEDDLASGHIKIICTANYGEGIPTETTVTTVEYGIDNRPIQMKSAWRENYTSISGVGYRDIVRTYDFVWGENSVTINGSDVETDHSGNVVQGEKSHHVAKIEGKRVVSGSYSWDNERPSLWTASYDSNGHLLTTKNQDGKTVWDSYSLTWDNYLLKKIETSYGGVVNLAYSDESLRNHHRTFDLNWVLPQDMEHYDFAAGDVTRHFAVFGFMGEQSPLLATEISESDSGGTRSCRMIYKENSMERTVVRVEYYNNGRQSYSYEYEINYVNVL